MLPDQYAGQMGERLTKLFFRRSLARMTHEKSPSNSVSLAPAAGAGIGRKVAEALLADPAFIGDMKEAAHGALKATVRRWDKEAEGWIVEPDYKTRVVAWLGILAHMEGDPVKRIIHENANGGISFDPLRALKDSPEMQEAVARLMQNARHAKQSPARAPRQVVEVEAESAPGGF